MQRQRVVTAQLKSKQLLFLSVWGRYIIIIIVSRGRAIIFKYLRIGV